MTTGSNPASKTRYRRKMNFVRKCVLSAAVLVASISTVPAADKDNGQFKPGPLESYDGKQTNNGVTIAAKAYDSPELAKSAFGKMNPYMHGVLPVLVLVQNDSKQTLKLDRILVQYIDADRSKIEATPARDVRYLTPAKRPKVIDTPIPGVSVSSRAKKGPLGG